MLYDLSYIYLGNIFLFFTVTCMINIWMQHFNIINISYQYCSVIQWWWGKWKELFPLEISYFQKGSPDRNLILPGGINFVFSKHSCNKYFITPNIIWYYTIRRVLNILFLHLSIIFIDLNQNCLFVQ